MNFTDSLAAFFATETGRYAALVLILPAADWLLGVLAALRDGTFQLDSVATFVRKHILGRVFPIWLLMFLGWATSSLEIPVVEWPLFTTVGTGMALLYIAETVGSILRSWGPVAPVGEPQTLINRDPVQPVPPE